MVRRLSVLMVVAMCLGALPGVALGAGPRPFTPGARGSATRTSRSTGTAAMTLATTTSGSHTDPATDRLTGVATIKARATKNLSRFNLDFVGLTGQFDQGQRQGAPDGARDGGELTITPRVGAAQGLAIHGGRPLRRRTRDARGPVRVLWVHPHRRWGARRRANRTSQRHGSRPTTIRGTRPRSPSGSRSRQVSKASPTASSRASAPSGGLDDLDVGRQGAHGHLPRRHGDRRVRYPCVSRSGASGTGTPSRPGADGGSRSRDHRRRDGAQFLYSDIGEPAYKRLTRTIDGSRRRRASCRSR